MSRPTTTIKRHYLFGGPVDWLTQSWTTTDDSLRGGSSRSHLQEAHLPQHPHQQIVRFYGCLDLQTLGGAGFASQKCDVEWDLSGYEGLCVEILKRKGAKDNDESEGDVGNKGGDEDGDDDDDEKTLSKSEFGDGDDIDSEDETDIDEDGCEKSGCSLQNKKKKRRTSNDKTNKLFTLILKDTTSEPNGRGYQKSSLSYEHSFRPSPSTDTTNSSVSNTPSTTTATGVKTSATATSTREMPAKSHQNPQTETLYIPFTSLTPTYRGRKIKPSDPEYHELDLNNIRGFSFMIRGFFGEVEEQEGEFELGVVGVRGYNRDAKDEDGWWYRILGVLRRVLGWFGK
ncbi:MAG: hypothetical protein M1831_005820 [Alyxoria varia]|nr:MAG: hypothetical protein M1831_005820 [Alyxoria varia]